MSKKLNISKDIKLTIDDILGKSIGILGIRGSGKTNTSAVIIEELLKYNFPIAIIDIDGEYWGLKEKYEILVAGQSDNCDIKINFEHSKILAKFFIEKEIPVILDFSDFLMKDIHKAVLIFLKEVWELSGEKRKPAIIVLEEAHEFIPQSIRTDLKEYVSRIALRGRKRGLGLIIISQRSAKVDKDVLTQCEMMFLHKVIHPVDLNVYKALLPLPSKTIELLITNLDVGECIFYFGNIIKKLKIRERYTYHAGFTPSFKSKNIPHLKQISKDIIDELKKVTIQKEKEKSLIEQLKLEIEKLEKEINEKDETIKRLNEQIELLSKLKLEISPEYTQTIYTEKDQQPIEIKNIDIFEQKDIVRQISRLIHIVQNLPKPLKEMLIFLIEHESNEYSYSQLATWLNYSEATLRRHPPSKLIKMGLIKKRKVLHTTYFSSNFRKFIEEEFKDYFKSPSKDIMDLLYQYIKNQFYK